MVSLRSDGSNQEHDSGDSPVPSSCAGHVSATSLGQAGAIPRLGELDCLQGVSYSLPNKREQRRALAEWQVACVAREGHLMSAESCAETCGQPLWLRSKLDPQRMVKENLFTV